MESICWFTRPFALDPWPLPCRGTTKGPHGCSKQTTLTFIYGHIETGAGDRGVSTHNQILVAVGHQRPMGTGLRNTEEAPAARRQRAAPCSGGCNHYAHNEFDPGERNNESLSRRSDSDALPTAGVRCTRMRHRGARHGAGSTRAHPHGRCRDRHHHGTQAGRNADRRAGRGERSSCAASPRHRPTPASRRRSASTSTASRSRAATSRARRSSTCRRSKC